MIIAIQSDDFLWPKGAKPHASAPHWAAALEEAGHEVRWVDVYRADILEQVRGCDGFMWRHAHVPAMLQIARRLLPVLERDLQMVVYPDQNTCWHYDDKIAQEYLFSAHGIPHPQTWIWYDREAALDWANDAQYPLVQKLWSGAGSSNVNMVHSADQAKRWIRQLFDQGVYPRIHGERWRSKTNLLAAYRALRRAFGLHVGGSGPETFWEMHRGYVYFQEYLPDNDFDIRITVIGNRAFGFRRFNRKRDFRASGSGSIDWDVEAIDPAFVRLALQAAMAIGTQSCAIDGLYRKGEPVLCEISYTYASWAVAKCPGHWTLEGNDPQHGQLTWQEGSMLPETAQIQDFIARLESRAS